MTSCVLAHAGLNFHKAGMQILLRVKIGHQRHEAPLLLFLIIKKINKKRPRALLVPQDQVSVILQVV